MTKQINVSDALEYCKKAAETALRLRDKSLEKTDDHNPTTIANHILASQYFEREFIHWEYDVPNMIKSLADGTWKEHFEEGEGNESGR